MIKISCTQENLSHGLMVVGHIANKNLNLPILSAVLIKIENKILTLSATNLEIGATVQIRSKVEEDGDFAVDAKLLSDYIALLPKERIDLELDEDNLKIQCQKQKTKIKKQAASEFPVIPKIKKENAYIVLAKDLKEAIVEVGFAVSNSETRPEISGVFANFIQDGMILAATDSYRLAEKKINYIEGGKKERKIIIPIKTLQEISRILGLFKDEAAMESAENVEIYLNDSQIMFSYNGVDLVSRLIEGQYPDYTQIIPTSYKTQIKVDTLALIKAVKTASLFTKSGIYDIKLDFSIKTKEITISSSSSQTGENISILESEIAGEDNNIVLNHRYLLDGLQNINSDTLTIETNNSASPCVLRPDKPGNYVYIIMPIKQ